MKPDRDPQSGVVLINVLAVVALASAVVITMLTLADSAIRRSQRFGDAAQAAAYALGAEASAIVALRRDAEEAPEVDHPKEAWATIAQEDVEIPGGRFSLAIEDAQSRFNVNGLSTGGMQALGTLRRIAASIGLPEDIADRTLALVRFTGPLRDIRELAAIGLGDDEMAAFSALVTALPGDTDINLNSASETLLAVLLKNPVAARFLVSRRDRAGFLTSEDLSRAQILLPPGVGYRSNYFRVTVDVTIGDTAQRLTSLIQRRKRSDRAEVVAVARQR